MIAPLPHSAKAVGSMTGRTCDIAIVGGGLSGGLIALALARHRPDVTIRLRNVTWAKGSPNKPSLVLYVHKDDPVRAESYSWADPQSSMIGINLRWVQASCSLTESNPEFN